MTNDNKQQKLSNSTEPAIAYSGFGLNDSGGFSEQSTFNFAPNLIIC